MKKISLIVSIIAIVALFITEKQALAVAFQPLGARILTLESPVIACPTGRAVTALYPFNSASPTPYYIPFGLPIDYGRGTIGGLMLANYNVTPVVGPCLNPETEIPVPVFMISPFYGTTWY